VTIYRYTAPVNVTFNSLLANGSATATTSQITLNFNQAITGLAAADITLTHSVSGQTVSKGTLSGSGSTYTLPISGFTAGGTLTVAVSKSGFNISNPSRTVTIYRYTAPPSAEPVFTRDILNDMFLTHEGIPHGVPNHFGWRTRPTKTYGINIPAGWNAALAWGQFYADQNQPRPDVDFPLARVHIKDLQLYIYRKNGTWVQVRNTQNPGGALYVEDFSGDANKPAEIRNESGGGISTKAGSGYNFHFWTSRTEVDRNDIAGVFAVCKARLIGYESYSTMPKYLLNIGADWWRNLTVSHATDFSNNNDIGIGRFKYVTPEWQYFIMHTFTRDELNGVTFPLE